MEYRVLKYFLIVAREENITRAAEILNVSQPALSRQLMQLEEELNTKLFIRGKRHLTLTDAGLLLRRRAQEIIDLTLKTEQEIQKENDNLEGTISIGSGEAQSMKMIAQWIQQFHELYPNVKFEIHSNNATYIQERLDRGLLDIGILLAPKDLTKYEYIPLKDQERWGALMHQSCPLTKKDYVTAQDLLNYKILIPKRDVEQGVANWFKENYNQLDILATYNLLYNAAMIVDTGMAIALTIEGAFSLYQNSNLVFKPFYPELVISSFLVYKKHQPLSLAVSKFIDFINMQFSYDKQ